VRPPSEWELASRFATLAARYTSGIQQLIATNPVTNGPLSLVDVDDSLALDAKLAFKAGDNLTFAISGENLTGAAGVYLSPVPSERRLRASIQARF